jgi:2-polyprenyl-3-methyl-5-hydroxy-6-metoxy-1,4-benzoquinol methylase
MSVARPTDPPTSRAADERASGLAHRPELTEETACPLCEQRDYCVVAQRDRSGRPLRTVMCQACGLVWTNPRPAVEEVNRYYATEYRLDYSSSRTPSRRKLLRGLLGAAERFTLYRALMPAGGRVLDIGCGAGEFVYLLRRAGFDASGIEPGEEYAAFCRDVLRIPVQTTTVEDADVPARSCALITMFHMLEHVADPRGTLEAIRGWLNPQAGRLVVEVPNVLSSVQAPRHRFHYAHLFNYSGETLAAFGVRAGLRVVTTATTPDGGNVIVTFAVAPGPIRRDPQVLPGNVRQTRVVLESHGSIGHYLGLTPYSRAFARLARRWREDRLLRNCPTVEKVLERAVNRNLADFGEPRLH